MKKKAILIGIVSSIIIAITAIAIENVDSNPQNLDLESSDENDEVVLDADVIMPTKVSRPGCETTNSCYVPSIISIKQGEQVTWSNEDVAFHSVTSGFYDSPTDLFNSGHMDPGQKFSVTFEEKGIFDYFCTLHPWMEGKVIVE